MAGRFLSRLSLLARFSILSLIVTVLIAAGLAYRLESTLVSDALDGKPVIY
ncbi:MAG: hypothetical protein HZB19_05230 [Chloroflexi bacterium]|nr:hypothetical protein [Chloroflexota bacterium]